MALFMICGCTGKAEVPADEPEPVPQDTDEPKDTEGMPVIPDDIFAWLDGNWLIVTGDADTNMSVALTFDGTARTARILRLDDEYILADLELFDSYDSPKTKNDAIRFRLNKASSYFIDKFGDSEYAYQSDMQFFTGYFEGYDFLFLRELGNGFSVIDMEGMGDLEKSAGDYGWFFVREHSGNSFPTLSLNKELRTNDGTFYAYCWGRGDTYLLQKVDVIEQDEAWYEGMDLKTIRVIPEQTEYRYTAFLYGGDSLPDEWIPGLVKVTVSGGVITDLREMAYIGYGAYSND